MIKNVLIQAFDNEDRLKRQIPGGVSTFGHCRFFFKSTDLERYDYLIVYERLPTAISVKVPKENTVFIAGEPESIRSYNPQFLSQFSLIITCQRNIKHKNMLFTQQALPWLVGIDMENNRVSNDYEYFSTSSFVKSNEISIISSNKVTTDGHRKRFEFVKGLSKKYGSGLSVFGRGINTISDKLSALKLYKYHIVIENDQVDDYWTEKLADCYLTNTFPIYFGCPNIGQYFPENSYVMIKDIGDIDQAIETIEKTISNHYYEKYFDRLLEAKKLVLTKYNLFAMINDICQNPSLNFHRYKFIPEFHFPKIKFYLRKIKNRFFKGMSL